MKVAEREHDSLPFYDPLYCRREDPMTCMRQFTNISHEWVTYFLVVRVLVLAVEHHLVQMVECETDDLG